MANNKILLSIALASTLIVSGCSNNSNNNSDNKKEETKTSEQTNSKQTKKEAYNFIVKDIDGNDVKLSDFKGKKIYINIWASWCGPCIREIPELEKVYQEIKNNEDIVFISITSPSDAAFENMNPADETKKVILDKANELGVTYPVLFDFQDKVFTKYSVRAFPTHIFINSDGTINAQIPGMMNEKTLSEHIKNLK